MTSKSGMRPVTRLVLDKVYARAAGVPQRLPWHEETPSPLLIKAVEGRGRQGRALDVGCGSGILAAFLAKQGMHVVAIDLNPEAVTMARTTAEQEAVDVDIRQADVLLCEPDEPFALVHDRGCLHGMNRSGLRAYRPQLLRWLAPGGDFVLSQFDRRYPLDWRPVGPRRRPQQADRTAVRAPAGAGREAVGTGPGPAADRPLGTTFWFRRVR